MLPDNIDSSKPHRCPFMHPNPWDCPCNSCFMARESAASKEALDRAVAREFAPISSLMPANAVIEPKHTQETPQQKLQRQRDQRYREAETEDWKPVEGNFPLLVFETQNKMDDFDAPDMTFGDESKETIEQYGLMKPFKQLEYFSHREGYTIYGENQFSLPVSEHFKRMRSLGVLFSNSSLGNLMNFETSSVFSDMVDKFERSEGGYYSNPLLTNALKEHETTAHFHKALKKCLAESLKNGKLPDDIVSISSQYMMSSKGKPLPKFDFYQTPGSLMNGTVLTVHDIWSMRVYVEQLEYKGSQVRGVFKYVIQDHFGLDAKDVDHNSFDDNPNNDGIPYEWLDGFQSWYLLQHFEGYGFKPFITKMDFKL